MGPHGKKPFKDKSFYLDLRYCKNQADLVKNIQKLGGKIETFLSRDISYVVTDRGDLKPKQDSWMPLTPKSLAFSPASPVNIYDSAIFDSPNNLNSSYSEAQNVIRSRGFAVLQKAKQNNQGTTDLLGVCTQFNIKIIHAQKLAAYISKYKLLSQKKNDENKAPQGKVQVPASDGKLYPPFIKVEDCECKYKPQYKMFANWKDAVDRRLCQFVAKLQSDVQKNGVGKPFKLNQSSNREKLTFSHSSLKPSPVPSNQSRMTQNSVQSTVPLNFSSAKQKFYPGILPKSARQAREKKKSLAKKKYCEICSCSFVTLKEHIITDYHRRFMSNQENFKAIETIVKTLPNQKDFLKRNEMMAAEQLRCTNDSSSNGSSISQSNLLTEQVLSKSLIQIVPNATVGDAVNDDTEEYVIKSEIVMASCTSDDMEIQYPFLEGNVTDNEVKQPDDCNYLKLQYAVPMHISTVNKPNEGGCVANGLEVSSFNPHNEKQAAFGPVVMTDACEDLNLQEVQKETEINVSLCALEEIGCHAVGNLPFQKIDTNVIFQKSPKNLMANETNCENKSQLQNLGFHNSVQLLCSNNQSLKNKKIMEKSWLCTSELSSVTTKNCGSVIRKFPFTNFGFGWSPSKTPNERMKDIVPQNSNASFNCSASDDDEKDSSYLSESDYFLKDLRSNVDNLCKSLEADDRSTSALDLSIPKSYEKQSLKAAVDNNTVPYNLPINDREAPIMVTA